MNLEVHAAWLAGLAAMLALCVFPPWTAHGVYACHCRIDRVFGLEFDTTRFFVEQGVLVLVTAWAVLGLRRRGRAARSGRHTIPPQ